MYPKVFFSAQSSIVSRGHLSTALLTKDATKCICQKCICQECIFQKKFLFLSETYFRVGFSAQSSIVGVNGSSNKRSNQGRWKDLPILCTPWASAMGARSNEGQKKKIVNIRPLSAIKTVLRLKTLHHPRFQNKFDSINSCHYLSRSLCRSSSVLLCLLNWYFSKYFYQYCYFQKVPSPCRYFQRKFILIITTSNTPIRYHIYRALY